MSSPNGYQIFKNPQPYIKHTVQMNATPSLKTLQDMYEQESMILCDLVEISNQLFNTSDIDSVDSDKIKALKLSMISSREKKEKISAKMAELQKSVPTDNLNQIKNDHLENLSTRSRFKR
jgi:hypothetical protein